MSATHGSLSSAAEPQPLPLLHVSLAAAADSRDSCRWWGLCSEEAKAHMQISRHAAVQSCIGRENLPRTLQRCGTNTSGSETDRLLSAFHSSFQFTLRLGVSLTAVYLSANSAGHVWPVNGIACMYGAHDLLHGALRQEHWTTLQSLEHCDSLSCCCLY